MEFHPSDGHRNQAPDMVLMLTPGQVAENTEARKRAREMDKVRREANSVALLAHAICHAHVMQNMNVIQVIQLIHGYYGSNILKSLKNNNSHASWETLEIQEFNNFNNFKIFKNYRK